MRLQHASLLLLLAAAGGSLVCWRAPTVAAAAAAAAGQPPYMAGAAFFEAFGPGWEQRWTYSAVKKYRGRFTTVKPLGYQDPAIQMPEANQHYGLSTMLPAPVPLTDGIVLQYEVKFDRDHTCGGAYLKLLSAPEDGSVLQLDKLKSKTPFSVMFGPDRCGPDTRVHVILRLNNPALNNVTEHHLMTAPTPKHDGLSHVYALVLHVSGRYKVLIDGQEAAGGKLLTAKFSPPLQPPETISDPEHIKPDDWVEEEMMDDPSAEKPPGWDDKPLVPDYTVTKPEGWLEHELPDLPDPNAKKPDEWDEAEQGMWLPPPIKNPVCISAPGCGPWKRPLVKNPHYRGAWTPPRVKNPAYKGPWKQREMPNPAYFEVTSPNGLDLLSPIGGIAFELWTTDTGYTFDSVLLGAGQPGLDAAAGYMRHVWRHRHSAEVAALEAEERAKSRPPGLRYWASNRLRDALEHSTLERLQPKLGGLLWLLEQQPVAGWAALLLPLGLLVTLLADRLLGGTRAAAAEEEEEDPEQEVEVDEDEVKRLSKAGAELQRARQPAAAAATAATAAAAAAAGASMLAGRADRGASTPAAATMASVQSVTRKQQQQEEKEDDGEEGGSSGGESGGSVDRDSPPPEKQLRRRAVSRRA